MSPNKRQPSRLIFQPQAKTAPKIEALPTEEERLRAAREMAAEYRTPKTPLPGKPEKKSEPADDDGVRPIEEWADIVTTRIEEAIRRGDFERLPGHGKPMRQEQEPFVPATKQMAYSILKNNDLTPSWIGERKEMLSAVEKWRADFRHVVSEAHSAWVAASSETRRVKIQESWARWLTRWEHEIVELNRRIGIFNLTQPITHLEIFKLQLDNELRQVGMTRHLGES